MKAHWVIKSKDYKTYHRTYQIVGFLFLVPLSPLILLGYIGQGCDWANSWIADNIIHNIAASLTILINKIYQREVADG